MLPQVIRKRYDTDDKIMVDVLTCCGMVMPNLIAYPILVLKAGF